LWAAGSCFWLRWLSWGGSPKEILAMGLIAVHDHYEFEGNAQIFNLTNGIAYVTAIYLTGASTFGVA
jgi:hypothetical protein